MNITGPKTPSHIDNWLCATLNSEETAWRQDTPVSDLALDRAHQHGVITLVYGRLTLTDHVPRPSKLFTRFADAVHTAAACDLLIEQELRRVLDVLQVAQLNVLLLKGTCLAYSIYQNSAARPRGDTDLLVESKDRTLLFEVLESLGYRPTIAHGGGSISYQATYRRNIAQHIEHDLDVHWRLFNLHILADVLPFAELHADRVALPRLHPHAFGPGPIHSLMYACLHRAAHHGETERLLWLWDIKLLAETLEEPQRLRLLRLSQSYGVTHIVRGGVACAQRKFPSTQLNQLLELLSQEDNVGVQRRIPGANGTGLDFALSDLAALQGWKQRFQYIWQHTMPAPEYMMNRYEVRARFLLPWFYLRRWGNGVQKFFRLRYSDAGSPRRSSNSP